MEAGCGNYKGSRRWNLACCLDLEEVGHDVRLTQCHNLGIQFIFSLGYNLLSDRSASSDDNLMDEQVLVLHVVLLTDNVLECFSKVMVESATIPLHREIQW